MSTLALALLALAPRADVRLTGRVLDSTGKPAANVHVVAGEVGHASVFYTTPNEMMVATPGIAAPESARWAFDVRSDAEGRFAVSGLAAGEFGVLAAHDGEFAIARARVAEGAEPLELQLESGSRIRFVVHDLAFDPAKHLVELRATQLFANVQFLPRVFPVEARPGESAANGWSFECASLPPRAAWRIVGTELVVAQDYRATLFDLPGPRNSSLFVEAAFADGARLAGHVTGPRGEPLANVSVVARSRDERAEERGALTDANGAFTLHIPKWGTWDVVARRWTIRELAGCGNGRQDVDARAELVVKREQLGATLPPLELQVAAFQGVPKVGDVAADFRVQTIAGTELSLASLRGKVVLLDFWATWCGICRVEFPRLAQTYAELAPGGKFEIIGVSVDTDAALVPRFVASREIRWRQTALGVAASNPIARLYNVNSTPATVLIDRDGKIAALDLVGAPLRAKIDELLRAP